MKMISRSLLTAILSTAFLVHSADGFAPYVGKHKGKLSWVDRMLQRSKPFATRVRKKGGLIRITSKGDPFQENVRFKAVTPLIKRIGVEKFFN